MDVQQQTFLSMILHKKLSEHQSMEIYIVSDNARRPTGSLLLRQAATSFDEDSFGYNCSNHSHANSINSPAVSKKTKIP